MTLAEKLNSMSLTELRVVWKALKLQLPCEHDDLYGVSFTEWAEAVKAELDCRENVLLSNIKSTTMKFSFSIEFAKEAVKTSEVCPYPDCHSKNIAMIQSDGTYCDIYECIDCAQKWAVGFEIKKNICILL